jgi:uncharacterized membrane protein YcaP (DUF421 family)
VNDVVFFFDGWAPILRIVLMGVSGYVTLLLLLRVSGQRTLSQMTPFDMVITVTIGSAFGRVLTAKEVSVAEVVTVFAVLVALQWLVVLVRSRVPALGRVLVAEPALLYHAGEYNQRALRRHRVDQSELETIVRQQGLGSIAEARAVILEPDGKFAVISPSQVGDGSALDRFVNP